MAQYYKDRPAVIPQQETGHRVVETTDAPVLSDFDKHRETLLTDDAEEGWASELRRYLGTMQRDVAKETDLVEWWQVSSLSLTYVQSLYLHSLGPCKSLPYTRPHRSRCSSCPGVFCSM